MILSQRATSPLNGVSVSNTSNNDNILGLSKNTSERRLGSAIHRAMFRTSTEQNLMAARNRFEINLDPKQQEPEPKSKLVTYQKRSHKSTNPTSTRNRTGKSHA